MMFKTYIAVLREPVNPKKYVPMQEYAVRWRQAR